MGHAAPALDAAPAPCANCGAAMAGPWCAQCGQKEAPLDPTSHDLRHEVIHEFLHVDGKIVQTARTREGFAPLSAPAVLQTALAAQ